GFFPLNPNAYSSPAYDIMSRVRAEPQLYQHLVRNQSEFADLDRFDFSPFLHRGIVNGAPDPEDWTYAMLRSLQNSKNAVLVADYTQDVTTVYLKSLRFHAK
ncbi:MAG: hypothetical protein M1830_002477, partial [Pleopsidium flavum]